MKNALNTFLISVLISGFAGIAAAQNASDPRASGIAAMFALDPLTQSLCFRDGGPGSVFQDGQTRNRCSDLNFNSYAHNAFRVGVEGSRVGVIVDLGTPEQLKARYGYNETVGNGQGFASIDVKNGKAFVLKDLKTGELQELTQAAGLFKSPDDQNNAAEVKRGHIYLMRITDRTDASFEQIAKVIVLAHVPGESVTIRWYLLSNRTTAKL